MLRPRHIQLPTRTLFTLMLLLLFGSMPPRHAWPPPTALAQEPCKVPPCEAGGAISDPFNARLAIAVDPATGRFNMGAFPDPSTGGATASSWDLMYRWPSSPRTSFTTLRVDGVDVAYGDSPGSFTLPPTDVDPLTNRSVWQLGDIKVTQVVQIVPNPLTQQEDLARISYSAENVGEVSHEAGLRIMVDTEIRLNDGAPFRVPGSGIITTETEFLGDDIPSTFQVFRDVTQSDYVASATLRRAGEEPPDRLVLAYWPRIFYTRYDYVISPGSDFTSDSAYAVYWFPEELAPGESRTYVTYYGLGEVDVDLRPPLALGVSGPAELAMVDGQYSPNPFEVVATVFNNGTAAVADVELSLDMPAGFRVLGGPITAALGTLAVGTERQVSWTVLAAPRPETAATFTYSVVTMGAGTPAKTLSRSITVPQLVAPAPAELGALEVTFGDYRFPNTPDRVGDLYADVVGDGRFTELWARVWRPASLDQGPYPLVVLLHGNHAVCGTCEILGYPEVRIDDEYYRLPDGTYDLDAILEAETVTCPQPGDDPFGRGRGPVVSSYSEVPNHVGYDYLAELLASQGYIVVSVNANRGINMAPGTREDPALVQARGRLVLQHLALWRKWATVGGAPASLGLPGDGWVGRIDFSQVGLMGHSRGGEGVRAAYNLYRTETFWQSLIPHLGVKAIFEIGPVDFAGSLNAPGVPWAVLLPMCDGDVYMLSGLNPFDRMLGAAEPDGSQKATYLVWGANHNFYNTEWRKTDSYGCYGHDPLFDDWIRVPGTSDTGVAQRQTAITSLLAFFRANLGPSRKQALNLNFNPLAAIPAAVSSSTRIDRGFTPGAERLTIDDFRGTSPDNNAVHGVANERSRGLDMTCVTITDQIGSHDKSQRAGAISWLNTGAEEYFQANLTPPTEGRDVSGYYTLDFRISRRAAGLEVPKTEGPLQPPVNLGVQLIEGDEAPPNDRSTVVEIAEYSEVLGPVGACPSTNCLLHPVLQTVRIPLDAFDDVDLTRIHGVRFVFNGYPADSICLANIEFTTRAGDGFPATVAPSAGVSGVWVAAAEAAALAAPLAQDGVTIELFSPDGFMVGDSPSYLKIGDADFMLASGPLANSLRLSPSDFDALGDGAAVTWLERPADKPRYFGTLDKSRLADQRLVLSEQLYPYQEDILEDLEALRPQVTGAEDGARLDAAIGSLRASLEADLWRDAAHVSGEAVFLHDVEALRSLGAAADDLAGTLAQAAVYTYMERIRAVARSLASFAIAEAGEGAPAVEARTRVCEGDATLLAHKDFASAVEKYLDAWTLAAAPLTVEAGPDRQAAEGAVVSLSGASLKGAANATYTVTIDWADGTAPETATITAHDGATSITGSHTYGDDGVYQVAIRACSAGAICASDSLTVTVANVAPTLTLAAASVITPAAGPCGIGVVGQPITYTAAASDPGSDDLTFGWSFGASATYYNDGAGADPPSSPLGVFPFAASDVYSATFDVPGVYTVEVDLTDDDGGTAGAEIRQLVTGDVSCTRSFGFWQRQLAQGKRTQLEQATLEGYLQIAGLASGFFSEEVDVTSIESASAVMSAANGPELRDRAVAQLLAAWLNLAQGAVGWDEMIDRDGDGTPDTPFYALVAEAEAILAHPHATHADLVRAKDLAEAVNLLDAAGAGCAGADDMEAKE